MSALYEQSFTIQADTDFDETVEILEFGEPVPLAGWSGWTMEWRTLNGTLIGTGTVSVMESNVLHLETTRAVTKLMQGNERVRYDVTALDSGGKRRRPVHGPRCTIIPYVTEVA